MILGAVVDAGVSLDALKESLAKMDADGYELTEQKAQRGGLPGTHVNVELDESGRKKRRWQDFVRIVEESSLSETVIQRSCAVFRRLAEAEAMVHDTTPEQTHLHELGEIDTLVDVVGGIVGLDMLGIDRLYASPFAVSRVFKCYRDSPRGDSNPLTCRLQVGCATGCATGAEHCRRRTYAYPRPGNSEAGRGR